METIFDNNYICILCTCNKEIYQMRLKEHEHTYSLLENNNFIIVYLYCNPNISDIHIQKKNNSSRYILTLPIVETYENLPNKIKLCINFFSKFDIKGILKIDDDTDIINECILDKFYYTNVDYTGAIMSLMEKGSTYNVNNYDASSNSIIMDIDIPYFGGPYYWISKKAIDYISKMEFKYPWEDVNIGYCLHTMPNAKIVLHNWYNTNTIYWK